MSASISRIRIFAADDDPIGASPGASASFRLAARDACGHPGLLSHVPVVTGKPGLCPRSEQADHPVHTFRLAGARWFRADWRI